MKVIFFISSSMQGKGGHYYSLLETASKLTSHCETLIVSIGVIKSPVLSKFDGRYVHVDETGVLNTFKAIKKVLNGEKADIYHAFDSRAFFYVRILSLMDGTPNVLTKCGGANAKHYPVCDELILYSRENLEYYKNNKNFDHTNITFLPNRVSPPMQDRQRIEDISEKLVENVPVILRIARLSTSYEDSILQSIKLIEMLAEKNITAQLIVVGVVQDIEVFNRLIAYETKYVSFYVEDEYNTNASELIDLADIVVGTGRGFMEAACLGKVMLAPTKDLSIPVLVNENNFLEIFRFNFSQRFISNVSTEDALKDIVLAIKEIDSDAGNAFIKGIADEYFMSENLPSKLMQVYKNVQQPSIHVIDVVKHFILKIYNRMKVVT